MCPQSPILTLNTFWNHWEFRWGLLSYVRRELQALPHPPEGAGHEAPLPQTSPKRTGGSAGPSGPHLRPESGGKKGPCPRPPARSSWPSRVPFPAIYWRLKKRDFSQLPSCLVGRSPTCQPSSHLRFILCCVPVPTVVPWRRESITIHKTKE